MYDVLALQITARNGLCLRRVNIFVGLITNHAYKLCITSEIIFTRWTFNFVYSMGRTIHEFQISTKY